MAEVEFTLGQSKAVLAACGRALLGMPINALSEPRQVHFRAAKGLGKEPPDSALQATQASRPSSKL
jgi:hypothetical protein